MGEINSEPATGSNSEMLFPELQTGQLRHSGAKERSIKEAFKALHHKQNLNDEELLTF